MVHRLSHILMRVLLGIFALALTGFASLAEGRKLALVVGNEAYENLPGLATPVSDAQAVSKALRDLGFEVTLLTDVGPEVFQAVLGTFAGQVDEADTVMFYYSGHAFQKDGVNHLVPVNAKLANAAALDAETWRLDDIAAALKGKTNQVLLFLDACRDTPLSGALGTATAGGLAQFDGGAGTFVAFATAPGAVAFDKLEAATHSPFTAALLAHIATPGIAISDMMIKVRNDVVAATDGKQTPWDQSSLRQQVYFVPPLALSDAETPEFELVAQATKIAPPPGTMAVIGQGVADDQLAMLESDTRSLNTAVAVALPDNLPLAVQGELKRIGCYGMAVDGDWGNGSRRAMATYYDAKKTVLGDVEPTEVVYRTLMAEPGQVCKAPAVVAKAPAKAPAKAAAKAATKKASTKKTATKKTVKKPAAVVVKKQPKCKFMVIAVVCS